MIDLTIPKNNEEEFVSIAKKLGYTSLFFLYFRVTLRYTRATKIGTKP